MKKTFYLIATAILTVMFVSCEEKEPTGPALNDALAFTLELDSVDATSAKIKVSHNGTKEDTWYGFATAEKDPLDKIEELVADLIADGGRISLKKSVQSTFSVKDLTPETDYTFVVVGLTDAGEVYGFPNSIEFTTGRDLSKLAEDKERWKISYERTEYEGEKCEGVTIECADEEIYYFEYIPEYYVMDESGNLLLAEYVDYVANTIIPEYVKAGYTYKDFCYEAGGTLFLPRCERGKYYAIVIGMGTDNVHNGAYTVQEFTVLEEEATAEYNQWIGTYTLTTSNETPITYTINIDHYDNNFMYAVTGWECGKELDEDKDGDGNSDGKDFGTAFGEWQPVFPVYFDNGKILFQEYNMTELEVTNEKNQDIPCVLGLYGYAMNGENLTIVLTDEGEILATGETTDAGQTATVTAGKLAFKEDDGTTKEEDCFAMSFAAIAKDYSDFFLWNEPAELPYTLTKVETVKTSLRSIRTAEQPVMKANARPCNFKKNMSQKAVKPMQMFDRM